MEKLTDNEIIKALPKVAYGGHSCNKCRYKWDNGENRCGLKGCRITRNALDLINRQKAEIERYKGVIKILEKDVTTAKSVTIKELGGRLKIHAYYTDFPKIHRAVDEDDIDAVLKEMVGD